MSSHSLDLQFNSTFGAKSRPNFIRPFTALAHLDTLGGAKGPKTSCAENAPHFLGIFGARLVKEGVLRKNIHRMRHNEVIEKQKVNLNLLIESRDCRGSRNRNMGRLIKGTSHITCSHFVHMFHQMRHAAIRANQDSLKMRRRRMPPVGTQFHNILL